jgi:hypothetical protein
LRQVGRPRAIGMDERIRLGPALRLRMERSGVSFARLAALADVDGRHIYQNSIDRDELERLKGVLSRVESGEIPRRKQAVPA